VERAATAKVTPAIAMKVITEMKFFFLDRRWRNPIIKE
jgi:hypothetical protein